MLMCRCFIQQGQTSAEQRANLETRLADSRRAIWPDTEGEMPVDWVEVAEGFGFTAAKPSQSSVVASAVPDDTTQERHVQWMQSICDAWSEETGCSVNDVVAKEITRIHCEVTGAPETFVHVFMFEDGQDYAMNGSIRHGRTEEQKDDLKAHMRQALADRAGIEADQVSMNTMDVMARWTMEGGDVLPEPGKEEAWLAKHAGS